MNRIEMLRLWHRDGCKLVEHARYTIRNGQIWILYNVNDPQGTKKFGYNFALLIVIDGRTDIIIGSEVLGSCLLSGRISQSVIDAFERRIQSGCNFQPEDIATPINNLEFRKGAPLPAIKKGPYEEPRIADSEITNIRWYTSGSTTTTGTFRWSLV
jgi:hypothetical protein